MQLAFSVGKHTGWHTSNVVQVMQQLWNWWQ